MFLWQQIKGWGQNDVNHNINERSQTNEVNIEVEADPPFQIGDHIYKWKYTGFLQYHAIVVSAKPNLLVVTEYVRDDENHRDQKYRVRLQEIPSRQWSQWRKVKYEASMVAKHLFWSGTCTDSKSDFVELVLARVSFLLEHSHYVDGDDSCVVPSFHMLKSNSECLAVYCKTGRWHTLQASSLLHTTTAGQVKSTATLALYASNQTVTVPASGIWGLMGFTTKVSLLSAQPYLVPALAGYGLFSICGPLYLFSNFKKHWETTTLSLNDLFWSTTDPNTFVKCIQVWYNKQCT